MIIPTHPTYWGRVFNEPKITFSAELPPAQQKSATRGKNYLSYLPTASHTAHARFIRSYQHLLHSPFRGI